MGNVRIRWSTKAARQARKLPASVQPKVGKAVDTELPTWRSSTQVKALVGRKGWFRLRVGEYRVLFTADTGVVTILTIEEMGIRNERTY